jgi:formylglycine-generating enzyme required for sulfatase activity
MTGENYRLPTEAEWEKAARGPEGFNYPWGNDWQSDYCNSDESKLNRTSPAGIFLKGKSPYGCMDMAGNVWEWCADWYDEKYYQQSPAQNPAGPASGEYRVLRGGSWSLRAGGLRSSFRDCSYPGGRDYGIGFRVVSVARTQS